LTKDLAGIISHEEVVSLTHSNQAELDEGQLVVMLKDISPDFFEQVMAASKSDYKEIAKKLNAVAYAFATDQLSSYVSDNNYKMFSDVVRITRQSNSHGFETVARLKNIADRLLSFAKNTKPLAPVARALDSLIGEGTAPVPALATIGYGGVGERVNRLQSSNMLFMMAPGTNNSGIENLSKQDVGTRRGGESRKRYINRNIIEGLLAVTISLGLGILSLELARSSGNIIFQLAGIGSMLTAVITSIFYPIFMLQNANALYPVHESSDRTKKFDSEL